MSRAWGFAPKNVTAEIGKCNSFLSCGNFPLKIIFLLGGNLLLLLLLFATGSQ